MALPTNRFNARMPLFSLSALVAMCVALALQASGAPPQTAQPAIPYIDAHVHLDDRTSAGVESMLESIHRQNLKKVFILVPPYTMEDPANYDAEPLLDIAKQHPNELAVVGGGGTLNAMLQKAVTSGDDSLEVERKFRARAQELQKLGVIGFGEMTTEHFPSPGSSTYQYAPADHPLMLILADVAAEYNIPIVIHTEAVPQDMPLPPWLTSPPNPPLLHANIAALGRLAAHNPHAKIIWAHLGSDNTGYRTPEICREMLRAHPNVYMEIKVDRAAPGKNPVVQNGKIKSDWLELFEEFPDRFLIGSDQHYAQGAAVPRSQAAVEFFNQLPHDLQEKIGIQNPSQIYGVKLDR